MTLKERIEAAITYAAQYPDPEAALGEPVDDPAAVLRDCAAEIERLSTQAENDADHARSLMAENERLRTRVAELEARTRPIPGVTDGSREYEPYTLDEVALIEAQRGKAYSRLRVTVRTMLALATNHAMLLGGNAEDYVSLPAKSGIAVLEFKARVAELEARAEANGPDKPLT